MPSCIPSDAHTGHVHVWSKASGQPHARDLVCALWQRPPLLRWHAYRSRKANAGSGRWRVVQAVKELAAEVEADVQASRDMQALPGAAPASSVLQTRQRVADLKADALQAWSDSF